MRNYIVMQSGRHNTTHILNHAFRSGLAALILALVLSGCSLRPEPRPLVADESPPTAVAPATQALPATQAPPATSVPEIAGGPALPSDLPSARVIKVVDGDTVDVLIDGREERVRLIGIDTPESVAPSRPVECYGREASTFTSQLLIGQSVLLEDDSSQANRDDFGRLLRYIWLLDGRMANYEIIAQGYGFEYTYDLPYRYQAEFRAAQNAARAAQAGLWAPETCNGESRPATEAAGPTPQPPPAATGAAFAGCGAAPDAASAPNSPIRIVDIDKEAEVVTLRNVSQEAVDLTGWILCSIRGAQIHMGIGGILNAGEEDSFPSTADENIWSNGSSDPGALYDAQGRLIAYWDD